MHLLHANLVQGTTELRVSTLTIKEAMIDDLCQNSMNCFDCEKLEIVRNLYEMLKLEIHVYYRFIKKIGYKTQS